MKRKDFLKSTLLTSAAITFPGFKTIAKPPPRDGEKLLNAYYFRAHMYTMVPRQVREDLQWMADVGTNIVSIAVLEQDLFAAVENIEIICDEASKLGMDVWAVPSRWGGLLAGAPKVPSLFTIQNHETWRKNKDGSYASSSVSGRISSIFHPATFEFMLETSLKIYEIWDIKGIMWDEPKSMNEDYHPLAVDKLGEDPDIMDFVWENVDFYSRLNTEIKKAHSDKGIAMFIYANKDDRHVDAMSQIKAMDAFGCDGRPWGESDGGKLESSGKTLLDGNGQRFIDAAKRHGKKSLWLIENHNMSDEDIPLLDKRLPEVVSTDLDHLIYYYYPRNLSQPDKIMKIIRENVKKF
jgi:hypothetical protein